MSGAAAADVTDEAALRAFLAADPAPPEATVLALLGEDHPMYAGVGGPAVVRMRGALLLACAERPASDAVLAHLVEELETAHDAFLTAVAAHVLPTVTTPQARFARPLLVALRSMRVRDQEVALDRYGGYGEGGTRTTATEAALDAFVWLAGHAQAIADELEALAVDHANSPRWQRALDAVATAAPAPS